MWQWQWVMQNKPRWRSSVGVVCALGRAAGWWLLQQSVQQQTANGFALVSAAHAPPDGPEGDMLVPVISLGKMMMTAAKRGSLVQVGARSVMTTEEAFCVRLFALHMVQQSGAGVF